MSVQTQYYCPDCNENHFGNCPKIETFITASTSPHPQPNKPDSEHDDEIYSQPMTEEQRLWQGALMYVRDKIVSPLMPPVKKYDKKLDVWLKSKDHLLIDKLAAKHTDAIMALVHQALTKELKYIDGKLLATEPEVKATSASEDDLNAWMRGYIAAYKEVEELIAERMALREKGE